MWAASPPTEKPVAKTLLVRHWRGSNADLCGIMQNSLEESLHKIAVPLWYFYQCHCSCCIFITASCDAVQLIEQLEQITTTSLPQTLSRSTKAELLSLRHSEKSLLAAFRIYILRDTLCILAKSLPLWQYFFWRYAWREVRPHHVRLRIRWKSSFNAGGHKLSSTMCATLP